MTESDKREGPLRWVAKALAINLLTVMVVTVAGAIWGWASHDAVAAPAVSYVIRTGIAIALLFAVFACIPLLMLLFEDVLGWSNDLAGYVAIPTPLLLLALSYWLWPRWLAVIPDWVLGVVGLPR